MVEKLHNVSDMIDTAVHKSRRLKEGILKADWEKIVGKICEKCQPDYIKNGTLYIKAEGNVYIHHLNLEKDKYIEKINEYFGEKIIKNIEIKSGKLDENREDYLVKSEKDKVENPKLENEKTTISDIDTMKSELNISPNEEINFSILEKITKLQRMAIERENYLLSNGYKKCPLCGRLYEGTEKFCRVCIDSGEVKKYLKSKESFEGEEE